MNINKLAEIAKNSGIKNSNNLRDNIVSEYSDTINSLNTIEESVINKNIEQLPVYKINEGHYSKSFETFLQIFFGNSVAKNYKENNEYKFDVRDNKIRTSLIMVMILRIRLYYIMPMEL